MVFALFIIVIFITFQQFYYILYKAHMNLVYYNFPLIWI